MSATQWPPELQLTAEEKRYWSFQDEWDANGVLQRRGVMPRLYTKQLVWTNITGEANVLTWEPSLTDQRSRIYGLTFSGSVDIFSIRCTRTPDQLILVNPADQNYVRVAALVGSPWTTNVNTATPRVQANNLLRAGPQPLLFPVDIECLATQSLLIEARADANLVVLGATRFVLNVIIHAWGFPGPLPDAWGGP